MSIRIRYELVLGALLFSAPAFADDPIDPLRERAKLGFEKYNAGQYAEAIVDWEAVYRQSGREKGYRVAFNLARAYDQIPDPTRAGDYYARYVREVDRRRSTGQTVEPIVAKQEADARARLEELAPITARVLVRVTTPTTIAIDVEDPHLEASAYVTYVAPGSHVVTFGTGAEAQRRDVVVAKGETAEVDPPPPPPPPPPPRFEIRTERPYPAPILYVAGGVTALSVIVPIILYSNASSIGDDYNTANTPERIRDDGDARGLQVEYESARANAYASLAIPIGLAAVTLGLTAFYYLGSRELRVPIARLRGAGLAF